MRGPGLATTRYSPARWRPVEDEVSLSAWLSLKDRLEDSDWYKSLLIDDVVLVGSETVSGCWGDVRPQKWLGRFAEQLPEPGPFAQRLTVTATSVFEKPPPARNIPHDVGEFCAEHQLRPYLFELLRWSEDTFGQEAPNRVELVQDPEIEGRTLIVISVCANLPVRDAVESEFAFSRFLAKTVPSQFRGFLTLLVDPPKTP